MEVKTVTYREFCKALNELNQKVSGDYRITLYDQADDFSPVKIGVNWSAVGTVSPDEAISFAQRLMEAAKAAEAFIYNGYEIVY